MNFQRLVITISAIVLIITLVFIGLSLSKASHSETWPPIVGDCPDYWIDMSGNGEQCFNKQSLGTCNIPTQSNDNTMNFNENAFSGNTGTCAKYKWATACNVTWDGITSGVRNPCDKST